MKKLISLLLAISMIVCAMPVLGATNTEEATNAVKVLSALDILNGDENGDLKLDNKITRAEFATLITRALDVNTKASKVVFTDVPKSHWGYDAIMNCYTLGIIKGCGDGTFKPEAYVSYDEAVKMTMCALGYELYAQSKGGWPTGYLVAANQMKVTEGVTIAATRGDIVQLLYNALSTPKMEQTSYGTKEEFSILNGKNGKEYRTLLTDMDIYVANGVIGESSEGEVEILISEDSEDLAFDQGDEVWIEINDSDIEEYQHSNVTVYVEKSARKEYKVICVFASDEGESLTIYAEDIKDTEAYAVEYYTTGTKTKTIKIDKEATMEYNKTEFDLDVRELMNCEDCEITFIENSGDNKYDKIVISHYISARVDDVHASKDRISLDGTSLTFDFEDEDAKIILTDIDGNKLDLYDFEEDDVVAVLSDEDTLRKYSNYIKIIKLTDSCVVGEIEETFTRNGKPYIVIDGVEYVDNTYEDLGVGDMGTFYIGITNNVIDFDGSVAADNYAYILEAALSNETFSKDTWQIKLLTKYGIEIYTLTDNASRAFDEYATDALGEFEDKIVYADLDASNVNRIISYKVNSQGKISKFDAAGFYSDFREIDGKYNERTQMLDGIVVEDYTSIFNLTSSDVDRAFYTGIEYLSHESNYRGYALRVDGDYEVIVITDGKSQYATDNGFAIVTKVTTTKDDDDNDIYKVSVVENEESKTIYFDEESETEYSYEVNDRLPIGSVIVYNVKGNVVNDYIVLGIVEDGELVVNEEVLAEEFDDDTEFVYGYIANEKRNKVSAGDSISISDTHYVVVTSTTNKYTYNDAGRNKVIEVGDYLAEDAYYRIDDEVTPVFAKIVDGDLIDIYTFNKRVILE